MACVSESDVDAAIEAVPAPRGHSWQYDHAADGERLRLFVDDGGQVGVAYFDGRWFVDEPNGWRYGYTASSRAPSLKEAMSQVLSIAEAVGWKFPAPKLTPATAKLIEILREAGARPTLDMERSFMLPCHICGREGPHKLTRVGTYAYALQGGMQRGDPVLRSVCIGCLAELHLQPYWPEDRKHDDTG